VVLAKWSRCCGNCEGDDEQEAEEKHQVRTLVIGGAEEAREHLYWFTGNYLDILETVARSFPGVIDDDYMQTFSADFWAVMAKAGIQLPGFEPVSETRQ